MSSTSSENDSHQSSSSSSEDEIVQKPNPPVSNVNDERPVKKDAKAPAAKTVKQKEPSAEDAEDKSDDPEPSQLESVFSRIIIDAFKKILDDESFKKLLAREGITKGDMLYEIVRCSSASNAPKTKATAKGKTSTFSIEELQAMASERFEHGFIKTPKGKQKHCCHCWGGAGKKKGTYCTVLGDGPVCETHLKTKPGQALNEKLKRKEFDLNAYLEENSQKRIKWATQKLKEAGAQPANTLVVKKSKPANDDSSSSSSEDDIGSELETYKHVKGLKYWAKHNAVVDDRETVVKIMFLDPENNGEVVKLNTESIKKFNSLGYIVDKDGMDKASKATSEKKDSSQVGRNQVSNLKRPAKV